MSNTADQRLGPLDALVEDVTDRLASVRAWGRELASEVAALPDTMRRLREGAESFQLVGQRLRAATSSFEEVTKVYESAMSDTAKRSMETATALRSKLDSLTTTAAPAAMATALDDFQRTFESLADLNPFLRRPSRDDR